MSIYLSVYRSIYLSICAVKLKLNPRCSGSEAEVLLKKTYLNAHRCSRSWNWRHLGDKLRTQFGFDVSFWNGFDVSFWIYAFWRTFWSLKDSWSPYFCALAEAVIKKGERPRMQRRYCQYFLNGIVIKTVLFKNKVWANMDNQKHSLLILWKSKLLKNTILMHTSSWTKTRCLQ